MPCEHTAKRRPVPGHAGTLVSDFQPPKLLAKSFYYLSQPDYNILLLQLKLQYIFIIYFYQRWSSRMEELLSSQLLREFVIFSICQYIFVSDLLQSVVSLGSLSLSIILYFHFSELHQEGCRFITNIC